MGIDTVYLVNTTTDASTRKQRRQHVRNRTIVLDDGRVRLLPARPQIVSLAWVEKFRKELVALQEQGSLQIRSPDNIKMHLSPEGEIDVPPPPPPNCFPIYPDIYPEELRGEILYTLRKERGEFKHDEGWTKLDPLERALQGSDSSIRRPPQVQETRDDAFPAPLPVDPGESLDPVEVDAGETSPDVLENLSDLLAPSGPPAFVADLPEDMVGGGEEPEDLGKPMYGEDPSPAPAPAPTPANGGGRRKKGRRLWRKSLFSMVWMG